MINMSDSNFSELLNELTNSLLGENILHDCYNSVLESRGVNHEVVYQTQYLINDIVNNAKTADKKYLSDIDGVSVKYGNFVKEIFNTPLNINYQLYNFKDKWYFENNINKVNRFKNGLDFKREILTLSLISISGQIDPRTFEDTVQHELHHLYQIVHRQKNFDDDKLYQAAKYYLNSPKDSIDYIIGEIIYMCLKCEQEAYTNGLYALLKKNYNSKTPKNTFEVLKESDVYNMLLRLRFLKKQFLSFPFEGNFVLIIQSLNMSREKFIKLIDNADKEIVRRIGRVIVQAQDDCNFENDMTWGMEKF